MLELPDIVRQDLVRLLPSPTLKEVACFVFFDNHPRDDEDIEITVCTKNGEVIEFYHREIKTSVRLELSSRPKEIRILRNSKCELFYLIATQDDVVILSRKDRLRVHKIVSNVDSYDIDDSGCRGEACLKIICKDDAVPLIFDDNFENLGDHAILLGGLYADDSLPVLTQLKRKLTEAKYSVKCNEKTYNEFVNLRQLASMSVYQKAHPNMDDSLFKNDSNEVLGTILIKNQMPWVKVCNKKIVIIFDILNSFNVPLEDVQVLLHTENSSLVYTTKLFEKTSAVPFWTEVNKLNSNKEISIVVVLDLKEIRNNISSKIDVSGVIAYKKGNKESCVPFSNITLTAMSTMGESFEALNDIDKDKDRVILSIIATSDKVDLSLRHIKTEDDYHDLAISETFCTYLNMENIYDTGKIIVHRKSPYHVLYGVMIIFQGEEISYTSMDVTVYARSHSQILALIHYTNDAIPYRILATTPNYKIISKIDKLDHYDEDISRTETQINHIDYALSVVKQISMILKYFDQCMIKMNENKNTAVQAKIGKEIDVFADGVTKFLEFRDHLLEEACKGIESLKMGTSSSDADMLIDD